MKDDFHLFDERADDGRPLDADLSLVTAYLARELSQVQVAAVERRWEAEPAFAAAAAPILAMWTAPVPDRWSEVLADAGAGAPTDDEIDAGWRRFERDSRTRAWDRPRMRAFAKAAAIVVLLAGPMFAIAQGVRHLIEKAKDATPAGIPAADVPVRPAPPIVVGESAKDAGQHLTVVPRAVVPAAAAPQAAVPQAAIPQTAVPQAASDRAAVPQGSLRVDPTPSIQILTADTAKSRGLVRFSNGALAAAIAGPARGMIILFAPTGVMRVAFGPAALGLDSTSVIRAIHPYRGDSLFVEIDAAAEVVTQGGVATESARVSGLVLDADGKVGRRVRMVASVARRPNGLSRSIGSGATLQGSLEDGSFILRGTAVAVFAGTAGTREANAMYWRVSADGSVVDTIGTFVVDEVQEMDPSKGSVIGTRLFRAIAPVVGLFGRSMYFGRGNRSELWAIDLASLSGSHAARLIRVPHEVRPVPDSVRDANFLMPSASALPAFVGIRVDAVGGIWLEQWRLPTTRGAAPDPARWTVVSPSGSVLGDVVMPDGLSLIAVGTDWVLGTSRDAAGFERIRVHRLVR